MAAPRVVFVGGSTPVLKALEAVRGLAGLDLAALFTAPGASPDIETLARDMGLAVHDAALLRTEAGAALLRGLAPDWLFSVNTTLLFSETILAIPARGALNMHPGRLPDYAGLHTHQWAIRNGETAFAATLHWMAARVDAGDIALQAAFPVTARDTGLSLFVKCLNHGAALVAEALTRIATGEPLPRMPQDLAARRLYTQRMALDGTVRWTDHARRIADFVRAADYAPFACPTYTPEAVGPLGRFLVRKAAVVEAEPPRPAHAAPGAVAAVEDAGVVVWAGQGAVRLTQAQPPDGKLLRGAAMADPLGLAPGVRLGGGR